MLESNIRINPPLKIMTERSNYFESKEPELRFARFFSEVLAVVGVD
jgi:hypothetical protein